MGIDEVGIDKVGIDEVGINRDFGTFTNPRIWVLSTLRVWSGDKTPVFCGTTWNYIP